MNKWDDVIKPDGTMPLVLSMLVVCLCVIFMRPHYKLQFWNIGIQWGLMLGARLFIWYMQNKGDKKLWRDFYASFFLILILTSSAFLLKPLKNISLLLIETFSYLFYYILYIPVWILFTFIFIPLVNLFKARDHVPPKSKGKSKDVLEVLSDQWYGIPLVIYSILAISLLLAVILLVYRLRRRIRETGSITAVRFDTIPHPQKLRKKKKWISSKDRVRKKFMQFEKRMDKKGFGRLVGEPPSTWFARLNLCSSDVDIILQGYEQVRYGEKVLDNHQIRLYLQSFDELERQMNKKDH